MRISPQSVREWCILARDVHVRIERITVELRVFERPLNGFQPEESFVDLGNHIVALETLALVKHVVFEPLCPVALRVKTLNLFLNSVGAPVRKFAVELMTPGDYRDIRVSRKIRVKKLIDVSNPGLRCNRRGRASGLV